jgi:RNA-directed DNA polymerase
LPVLEALRSARTRYDVAALLGYKPTTLSYIVHRIPKKAKYSIFEIKKKSGGVRRIDAPIPMLKGLQKRLAGVLYDCVSEIEESEKRKNNLSHAFRKSFSIISNATVHKSRRYVLKPRFAEFLSES